METFSFEVAVTRSESNFDRACDDAMKQALKQAEDKADELEACGHGYHGLHSIQVKFERLVVEKVSWRDVVEYVYTFGVSGVWSK